MMKSTVLVRLHRRGDARPALNAFLLVSAGLLAACGLPGPEGSSSSFDRMRIDIGLEDADLHVLRAGELGGQRVIFVHGTPGSSDAWTDFLTDVPDGFEFLAIDRPGFGDTGGSAMVSLAEQAAALRPLMEREDARGKPVLVGHSLGGPIVAQAAADFPDLVGGIVIVAGSLDPALEKVHPLQPVGEMWPIRHLLPGMIRNSNQELLALKPELEALADRLAHITTPTIILHGTKDGLVPFENVAFMEDRFADDILVDTVVIEDGNHFLPWNNKDLIDAAVLRLADLAE